MRDTHRSQHNIEERRGEYSTTPTHVGLLSEINKKDTDTQPTATQLEIDRPITSPDASDVRNYKKPPKIHPNKPDTARDIHAPPSRETTMNALQKQLRNDTLNAKRKTTKSGSEKMLHSLHN